MDFFLLFLDFFALPSPSTLFGIEGLASKGGGGSVFSARTHTHTYTFGKRVLGKEKGVGDGDAISFPALVGGNSPNLSTGKLPE